MTLKMSATTSIARKTSRLLPPSFGLAVTIVIVIAAIYGLLLIALSTFATAYSGPVLKSYGDPDYHGVGGSNQCSISSISDPCQVVAHRG